MICEWWTKAECFVNGERTLNERYVNSKRWMLYEWWTNAERTLCERENMLNEQKTEK
jgi:hypothetical protein